MEVGISILAGRDRLPMLAGLDPSEKVARLGPIASHDQSAETVNGSLFNGLTPSTPIAITQPFNIGLAAKLAQTRVVSATNGLGNPC